jgi:hypothetical protein
MHIADRVARVLGIDADHAADVAAIRRAGKTGRSAGGPRPLPA